MAPAALPATALLIELAPLSETKRRLTMRAHGPGGPCEDRPAALRHELFGAHALAGARFLGAGFAAAGCRPDHSTGRRSWTNGQTANRAL